MAWCPRRRPKTSPLLRGCWLSRCEMARVAVVLMNLGGPDSPAAVRPFLYNLFSDPAIIDLPALLRQPLAWLIARQRSRVAGEIYAHLGGAWPLLANTKAEAGGLDGAVGRGYCCLIAM